MALSFATDIRPLFREGDVDCMKSMGVELDDPAWMCVRTNAKSVYDSVAGGSMPRMNRGRRSGWRCSRHGWTRAVRSEVVGCGQRVSPAPVVLARGYGTGCRR